MNNKEENIDWKLEAPTLSSLAKTNAFSVPNHYFDNLQANIKQSVFLASLNQKDCKGFTIPENYFEELSANIEAKITLDKFKNSSDNDGFKTPQNYFNNLNKQILSKTAAVKPKSKVFKLWNSDIMKYAAAACFIIVSAIGLYVSQQSTIEQNIISQIRSTEIVNEQMLYDIDESVILEHLMESESITSTAPSDAALENYILDHYTTSDLSNNL